MVPRVAALALVTAVSAAAAPALAQAPTSTPAPAPAPPPPRPARVLWVAQPVDNSGAHRFALAPGEPAIVVGENLGHVASHDDLFLEALDADGSALWHVAAMAKSARAIARAKGRVYVGCEWTGDLDFAGVRASAPWTGAFVGALDAATGALAWGRPLVTGNFTRLSSVVATADGGVAAALGVFSPAPSGPLAVRVAGGEDAVVVKYDAAGALAWTRTFDWPGYDEAVGLVPTPDGGVVVAGTRWKDASAESYRLAEGPSKGFVTRLGPDGVPRFGVDLGAGGTRVTVTRLWPAGAGFVVAGQMRWRNRLGTIELDAGAKDQAWLAGLDERGAITWARFRKEPSCLVVDGAGRLVVGDASGLSVETAGGEATSILAFPKDTVVGVSDCALDDAGALWLGGYARPGASVGGALVPEPRVKRKTAWLKPWAAGFVAKLAL